MQKKLNMLNMEKHAELAKYAKLRNYSSQKYARFVKYARMKYARMKEKYAEAHAVGVRKRWRTRSNAWP